MIKLTLQRLLDTGKQTVGRMYINDMPICYTLEDTYRPVKIKHKTRIPAGNYKLVFRKFGRFYEKFSKRFKDIGNDRGMIWVTNVPNYEDILIHIGNTEADTSGCILVGSDIAERDGDWSLIASTVAYRKVYPMIASLMEEGTTILHVQDEKDAFDDVNALRLEDVPDHLMDKIKKGS